MRIVVLLGVLLVSLVSLAGEAKAKNTGHEPTVGHCIPALTIGGASGFVQNGHGVHGEYVLDFGGAVVCRVTRRFEILVEVAIGPILPNFDVFETSFTTAFLYEPHHLVRVGGALMPSLLVGGPHAGGGILVGPAVQITLIPGKIDLMVQAGPKVYFPDRRVGAEVTLHVEIPFH